MEITCTRCHQPVQAEAAYCPTCGLPQLVYSADAVPGQAPPERWNQPIRDASTVEWKPALRLALLLALPAGLLSSSISPLNILGLFWMSAAASWAVVLYVRGQRPAWITVGAGARIGLVTGLAACWLAFAIGGGALFVQRYIQHQSAQVDSDWRKQVDATHDFSQRMADSLGPDFAAQMKAGRAQNEASMLSPEGHATGEASNMATASAFLLFFAVAGGALGARLLARTRPPEV
jgi:hypothetical protein